MSGHRGDASTLNNMPRLFYWHGMYKWGAMLIHGCSYCQNERHDLNEALLQQRSELGTTLFHTLPINHTGPFRHSNKSKHYCLVVVDSFSRYAQLCC